MLHTRSNHWRHVLVRKLYAQHIILPDVHAGETADKRYKLIALIVYGNVSKTVEDQICLMYLS
jgi:hypothetical protein